MRKAVPITIALVSQLFLFTSVAQADLCDDIASQCGRMTELWSQTNCAMQYQQCINQKNAAQEFNARPPSEQNAIRCGNRVWKDFGSQNSRDPDLASAMDQKRLIEMAGSCGMRSPQEWSHFAEGIQVHVEEVASKARFYQQMCSVYRTLQSNDHLVGTHTEMPKYCK